MDTLSLSKPVQVTLPAAAGASSAFMVFSPTPISPSQIPSSSPSPPSPSSLEVPDATRDQSLPSRPVAEFLFHLTRMLTDPSIRNLIEWTSGCIKVNDPHTLESEVLGKYFRHSKYSSFQRQLNYFGFRKVGSKGRMSPCTYINDDTSDDLSSLLSIKRKTANRARSRKVGSVSSDGDCSSVDSSKSSSDSEEKMDAPTKKRKKSRDASELTSTKKRRRALTTEFKTEETDGMTLDNVPIFVTSNGFGPPGTIDFSPSAVSSLGDFSPSAVISLGDCSPSVATSLGEFSPSAVTSLSNFSPSAITSMNPPATVSSSNSVSSSFSAMAVEMPRGGGLPSHPLPSSTCRSNGQWENLHLPEAPDAASHAAASLLESSFHQAAAEKQQNAAAGSFVAKFNVPNPLEPRPIQPATEAMAYTENSSVEESTTVDLSSGFSSLGHPSIAEPPKDEAEASSEQEISVEKLLSTSLPSSNTLFQSRFQSFQDFIDTDLNGSAAASLSPTSSLVDLAMLPTLAS